MKWLELNKMDSEKIFDDMSENNYNPATQLQLQDDKQYLELRKEVYSEFKNIMNELNIKDYNDAENHAYDVDYRFGIKLFIILKKYGMNKYIASRDGVWRYLQLKIFPDLVFFRWRYTADRFYKLSRRIWLKTIFWYAFLAWRDDEKTTRLILKGNTADTIIQLVERTGTYGYRVELYNEILFQKYKYNIKDQDTFRKTLALNTMRVKVIDPYLSEGGIKNYVKKLLIDSGANIGEGYVAR